MEKRKEGVFAARLAGLEACGAGGAQETGGSLKTEKTTHGKHGGSLSGGCTRIGSLKIKHHATRLRALRTEYPEFFD